MKVLIIGLGYSGERFRRAFEYAGSQTGVSVSLAYVGRQQKPTAMPYFESIDGALQEFNPDIVVASVNDVSHASVLRELAGYQGFVVCEKPLVTPLDDLRSVRAELGQVGGFALNLIERYSDAAQVLRSWVARHEWRPVRASFHWGKDRINDYRPTCGVTSEAIHALDLLSWICPAAGPLHLVDVIGIRSDFSVSGDAILDTVQLNATLGDAPVAGYSSFVSVVRQRTIDFTFVDQEDQLIHARLTFDTPRWDHDELRIWMRDTDGTELVLHQLRVSPQQSGLETLHKLSRLCQQVLQWVTLQQPPALPFASLDESLALQRLLNELEHRVRAPAPARYNHGATRALLVESNDLETLG
tara:strand:+ start:4919 stop:5989 length:1071 start_codon:yes stop_codon:yes gene_type:complete